MAITELKPGKAPMIAPNIVAREIRTSVDGAMIVTNASAIVMIETLRKGERQPVADRRPI
jgi:hypothetical protein